MIAAIAHTQLLTGTDLIDTACQKYEEAAARFGQLKANWHTLPAQEAVTLILETQAILRETRRILDQATSQVPVMNGPEWQGATGSSETGSRVIGCLQQAFDLSNRINDLLERSQELIQTCLAHEEARERYQTGKALLIVAAAAVTVIIGAVVALLFLF